MISSAILSKSPGDEEKSDLLILGNRWHHVEQDQTRPKDACFLEYREMSVGANRHLFGLRVAPIGTIEETYNALMLGEALITMANTDQLQYLLGVVVTSL